MWKSSNTPSLLLHAELRSTNSPEICEYPGNYLTSRVELRVHIGRV